MVIYTGKDTKIQVYFVPASPIDDVYGTIGVPGAITDTDRRSLLPQMNNSLPPFKTSVLTRALNRQLMYCFAVFGVRAQSPAFASPAPRHAQSDADESTHV